MYSDSYYSNNVAVLQQSKSYHDQGYFFHAAWQFKLVKLKIILRWQIIDI
jgi:hypothetical protein